MTRRIAWALVAVAFAAVIAGPVISVAAGASPDVSGVGLVLALSFPVLGAVVVQRQGGHAVGWLMIGIGVSIALHLLADVWSHTALIEKPGSFPAGDFFSWVTVWLWIPGWALATSLLPVLFPDGRPRGRRRLLAWLDSAAVALMVTATAVISWPLRGAELISDQPSPDMDPAFELLQWVYVPLVSIIGVLSVVSFGSLLVRYRRADADTRRQIAWVVYGGALAIVLSLIGATPALGGFVQVLVAVVLAGSMAVAMLRYRLYDIDIVVNRTLVYGALTAILAGTYLASVLLLQLVLSPSSDLAIAGSTLAVAALFRPARARIQTVVDRRFYRNRYDAARTLESFSARLRDEVGLEALGAELRGVVAETMQPAHVSLWLRPRTERA